MQKNKYSNYSALILVFPFIKTDPVFGFIKPSIILINVVFPEPDSPKIPRLLPLINDNEILFLIKSKNYYIPTNHTRLVTARHLKGGEVY